MHPEDVTGFRLSILNSLRDVFALLEIRVTGDRTAHRNSSPLQERTSPRFSPVNNSPALFVLLLPARASQT